jgi:hypothetical protein
MIFVFDILVRYKFAEWLENFLMGNSLVDDGVQTNSLNITKL